MKIEQEHENILISSINLEMFIKASKFLFFKSHFSSIFLESQERLKSEIVMTARHTMLLVFNFNVFKYFLLLIHFCL